MENAIINILITLRKFINYSIKSITKLKQGDGSFTTIQLDILDYESLYQSQLSAVQDGHDDDVFFNLNDIPALAEEKHSLCEGLVTKS